MVRIQKLTRQRYTFAPHCGDLVLEANAKGDDALENEDVSNLLMRVGILTKFN